MKKMYLGTMTIPKGKMEEAISAAIEAGYYGIDSAWVYKNEEAVGAALASLESKGITVKVQTKLWVDDFEDPWTAFEGMLGRLKQKHIYSLLLHRPSLDFHKTIHAWKQLIEMKKSGLVKHIGVSNFDKDMIKILIEKTGIKPEINQIEASIFNFRNDRLNYNKKQTIETQGWSVFGKNIKESLQNSSVISLSNKHNATPSQILVSFLTSQGIIPILGSSSPYHIRQNTFTIELDDSEIEYLKKENIFDNKFSETYSY